MIQNNVIKFFKSFDYPSLIFFILSFIWLTVTYGLHGFVAFMFFGVSINAIRFFVKKYTKKADQAFIRYLLYVIVGVIIAFIYIVFDSQSL